MTFEGINQKTETGSLSGPAAFLQALGALPQACIDALEGNGIEIQIAPGKAQARHGHQRLGSNVVRLV